MGTTNDPFSSPLGSTSTPQTPDYFAQAMKLADASKAEAVTGSFDESKGIAGRVQQLTDYGSPLMTAARTRAKQNSAKLGLSNSSTAAQAGEQAVIETATPIASGDAQLYQNQQLANQNALNQANLTNANIKAQTGMAGLQLGENSRQFGTNLLEQRRQFDASLAQGDQQFGQNLQLQKDSLAAQREQFQQQFGLDQTKLQQQESQFARDQQSKITLAQMDADSRQKLIEAEAKYKTDIAGNENISRAWGTMMDSINQIQNNPDLDQAAKTTLINNTQASFQSFANFWNKVSGSKADISDLLNFGPTGGGTGTSTGSSSGSSTGGRGTGRDTSQDGGGG